MGEAFVKSEDLNLLYLYFLYFIPENIYHYVVLLSIADAEDVDANASLSLTSNILPNTYLEKIQRL